MPVEDADEVPRSRRHGDVARHGSLVGSDDAQDDAIAFIAD